MEPASMTPSYHQARNPTWANPQQTAITLDVDFSFITDEWVPFTASPNDSTPYGPDLFARAAAGEFGPIAPYVAPPPAPVTRVTRAQAKIALHNAGLLTQVEALLAAHPYPPVRIWYEDALHWERDNPYLAALAIELGLDDDAVDALFQAASLLG